MLTGRPLPASAPYPLGVYGRNLEKDLRSFQERLGSVKAAALSFLAREIFSAFRNALAGRERVDTITFDDPVPGLSELWHGVTSPVRKLGRRVKGRLERTIRAFLAARPTWRRLQRRELRRRIAAEPRILFVCRGKHLPQPLRPGLRRRPIRDEPVRPDHVLGGQLSRRASAVAVGGAGDASREARHRPGGRIAPAPCRRRS